MFCARLDVFAHDRQGESGVPGVECGQLFAMFADEHCEFAKLFRPGARREYTPFDLSGRRRSNSTVDVFF